MGFIKEVYSGNKAGLVVSFAPYAYETDSIQDAMEHFNLYVENGVLMARTEEAVALKNIGVDASQAVDFREKVNSLINAFDDKTAVNNTVLFPVWDGNGVAYTANTRIQYNGVLYKVLQDHTSQPDWSPAVAPSLFAKVLQDEVSGEVLNWVQPDSTNGYSLGAVVKHNDKYWKSLVNDNVWEPGATGVSQWKQCDINGEDIVAEWTAGTTYQTGDVVMYNGSQYKCVLDNCVWSPNDLPSAWELI